MALKRPREALSTFVLILKLRVLRVRLALYQSTNQNREPLNSQSKLRTRAFSFSEFFACSVKIKFDSEEETRRFSYSKTKDFQRHLILK